MRTIRIKVKHILSIVILVTVLFVFGDQWIWKGIQAFNKVVAEEMQIDPFSIETSSIKAENARLSMILSEHDYSLYNLVNISDGATVSGSRIKMQSGKDVMAEYLEFEAAGILNENLDYCLNVALVQWFSGAMEESTYVLDAIDIKTLKGDDWNHYHMIRLGMALTFSEVDEVLILLESIDDDDFYPIANEIRTFLSVYFDETITFEEEAFAFDTYDKDSYFKYFETIVDINNSSPPVAVTYDDGEQSVDTPLEGSRRASGLVTINGQPVKGAFVYEDINRGMSTLEGFEYRAFPTDEEGYFQMDSVYEKTDQLGLLIPWQLIHDKQFINNWQLSGDENILNFAFTDGIKFESLASDGEAILYKIQDDNFKEGRTYSLRIRSVDPDYDINGVHVFLDGKIDSLEGRISIEDLKRGLFSTYVSVSGPPTFERLMEPLYLSGDYYFELTANEPDNSDYIWNGLFTDANAYTFYIEGLDAPSEGDLLIKEGKLEEAISFYEANIDAHSLKVLSALYGRGYIEVADVKFQPWQLGGADLEKSTYFLNLLMEEYGRSENILSMLAWRYKDLKDYQSQYEILIELQKNYPNVYYDKQLAQNTIDRGAFLSGLEALLAVDLDLFSDEYVPYVVLANRPSDLPLEYKDLYKGLDQNLYLDFYGRIIDGKYDEAWVWLEGQSSSDLKNFYRLMMLDVFATDLIDFKNILEGQVDAFGNPVDFAEYYRMETEKMTDENLKAILKLMKKENNWF